MRKITAFSFISFVLLLCACRDNNRHASKNIPDVKGGVYRGGIMRVNEVNTVKSLLPVAIREMSEYHVASQVYEGLVKYNPADLTIIPALAKSWDISPDFKEYTFHLRSNVKFHDNPCFKDSIGRYVTSKDIKYCFENLCSMNVNNRQYTITFKDRVEGANDFFAQSGLGKVRTFTGITVIDDSTLKIKLIQGDANFLNILAMPGCYIYPREAESVYGSEMKRQCVGTGPFFIETLQEDKEIVMKRNPNYWGTDKHGNRLPYLDGIKWTFIPDKKAEVMEFRRGNYDMIYGIPVDMFHEVFKEKDSDKKKLNFDIYASPALSTCYYGFNLQANPFFAVKEIRQAFNLAVDRQKLVDYIIKGDGNVASYGIVPYTELFERSGYNYEELRGYTYRPDSARKLMALAGYAHGKGLPDFNLEVNGGDRTIIVALAIQKMLKENLGVNVNMNVTDFSEHINKIQRGKSDFFCYAVSADYPDPESFLTLFYGKHVPQNYQDKSPINSGRFKNNRFDSLFCAAQAATDKALRYKLFSEAEQIVLDEFACMPLFYEENFMLEQKNVRNLPENPMNYIDMSTTYLVPEKE